MSRHRSSKPFRWREAALPLAAAGGLIYGLMHASSAHADVPLGPFTVSGFADLYYVDDFDDGVSRYRQLTPSGATPVYSHGEADRLEFNNVVLDGKYAGEDFRAALGVQAGTYVDANYAAEPEALRHLYEANAGVRVADHVWIDGGLFASHIGLESALSKDDWALTRSIMAENTPYFETGAKATWDPTPHWTFSTLLLQGWQTIESHGDGRKAFGTQVQYKPSAAVTWNSSTYVGDAPGFANEHRRRYFHDFYVTWQVNEHWSLATSVDYGAQWKSASDHALDSWYSGQALARYAFSPRWSATARVEHYHDPHGLTIATGTPRNFVATGGSLGVDCALNPHLLLRGEYRELGTRDAVFVERSGFGDSNHYATLSAAVNF